MSNYVLVVDDNPSDQKMAKLFIEKEGWVVMTAADAHAAIDMIDEHDFKLFVIDIQMPQISGLGLLRRLKKMSKAQKVPVLMMSGRNTADDVKKAIGLGAVDYVVKPIDPMIFGTKLGQILKAQKSVWKECQIKEEEMRDGHVLASCELLSISEVGATLNYSSRLEVAETVLIRSSLLSEIDVGIITGRCTECTKKNEEVFEIKITFVGLKEGKRQKIRKYCYTHEVEEQKAS